LIGSDNHAELINFQKFLDYVWAKKGHSILFLWVTNQIRHKTLSIFRVVWIAP
jgi:hypothetical protein